MAIPVNHPQRFALNFEMHARPPDSIIIPERVSYLALAADPADPADRRTDYDCIVELCTRYGLPSPAPDSHHFQADLGVFRLKWERHTEFNTYTFFQQGEFDDPFAAPVIGNIPQDWLESLPGQVLVAAHVALRPAGGNKASIDDLSLLFEGNPPSGARVGDGVASVYADFRVHADGFSRFLIDDVSLAPRQAGRLVQRLLDIETYWMRALFAFPVARAAMPDLVDADRQLALLINEMVTVATEDEPALLDRLTRLAASVESTISATLYRICASRACREIVERRMVELREVRVEGLPTLREFVERRLLPAMSTCETVGRLQESLSERISRASELLRTRVDITLQQQNQAILSATARRAKLQLHLQQTVEGLSVAAISYYVVGLIGYGVKALKAAGVAVDPDMVTGAAIPIVAVVAALGIRHIRRVVQRVVR
jgi:uncharacterized membrane-anchored protein